MKLYKEHKQKCHEAKRRRLLTLVDQAQDAASKGDARTLFRIVNALSPKTRRKRTALCDNRGNFLSLEQQADCMAEHLSERFYIADDDEVALSRQTWPAHPDILPDEELLYHSLTRIPLRKATPPNQPPSAAWRILAPVVVPWLHRHLRETFGQGSLRVDPAWTGAHLALIPKPSKSGKRPEDYRPIGLQCPLGKATLASLLEPVKSHILGRIATLPQFAYQPGRSLKDALRRVFQHCWKAPASVPNIRAPVNTLSTGLCRSL